LKPGSSGSGKAKGAATSEPILTGKAIQCNKKYAASPKAPYLRNTEFMGKLVFEKILVYGI